MRYIFAATATVLLAMMTCGAAIRTPGSPAHASGHLLSARQAQQLVALVAAHDRIDLSDTHVEVNSLDLMSPFIPGYASFILVREATSPGPDQTLHRYAVNRRTGDVWEMTQCTHYDFPALSRLQRALTRRVPTLAEIAAERQELGCSAPQHAPPPTNPSRVSSPTVLFPGVKIVILSEVGAFLAPTESMDLHFRPAAPPDRIVTAQRCPYAVAPAEPICRIARHA